MTDTPNHKKVTTALSTTDVSEKAQVIAEFVHAKQVDKGGAAYIDHPRRVSLNAVRTMTALHTMYSPEEIELVRQAAWLHDVVEDSGDNGFPKVTLEDLAGWGIAQEVLLLVGLVTKPKPKADSIADDFPVGNHIAYNLARALKISEDSYFQNIKANKLARALKIADLTDNCNLDRIEVLEKMGGEGKFLDYKYVLNFFELSDDEQTLFSRRINLNAEITEIEWVAGMVKEDSSNPYQDDSILTGDDLYYRTVSAGGDANTAYWDSQEALRQESLFYRYIRAGYSNERAHQRAREEAKNGE
jgi:hypothetical protein